MNLAKSYEFFRPEMCRERIHIIGCGAIGSHVAEQLVRYGLTNITLYDFDRVEAHNIANQIFTAEDIGKTKVQALAEYLTKINPDLINTLKLADKGYTGQRLSGYVFLAVDNIDLRREIATAYKGNMFVKGMFDFRMGLTDAQHYAAAWNDQKMVEGFINSMAFSHEEAQANTPVSACNMTLSVCSTVKMVVSCGVANFINFVKDGQIKKMIMVDAFAFDITAL